MLEARQFVSTFFSSRKSQKISSRKTTAFSPGEQPRQPSVVASSSPGLGGWPPSPPRCSVSRSTSSRKQNNKQERKTKNEHKHGKKRTKKAKHPAQQQKTKTKTVEQTKQGTKTNKMTAQEGEEGVFFVINKCESQVVTLPSVDSTWSARSCMDRRCSSAIVAIASCTKSGRRSSYCRSDDS